MVSSPHATNSPRSALPLAIPLAALALAAAHLTFEHFNGGVQSHHLLQRADMPAMSNWWGLVILPLLGIATAWRWRGAAAAARPDVVRRGIVMACGGALLYGAAMAASFEFGATNVTFVALLGLLACGLALPVHRAEYVLGFVAGMTFTFGSVIPLLIAGIVGTLSFIVRTAARAIAAWFRARHEIRRLG